MVRSARHVHANTHRMQIVGAHAPEVKSQAGDGLADHWGLARGGALCYSPNMTSVRKTLRIIRPA
jgi:hypothetical protein